MIIGVPRAVALPDGAWRGFKRFRSAEEGMKEIARLDGAGRSRPRRELEIDPAWKQPIPYAIALYRDASGARHLFWMDRLAGGSDRRLHGRASFGVGGHIGAEDRGILAALEREWREEVETTVDPNFVPLGLLNDDNDEVGRVHLGVVFLAQLSSPEIAVREREACRRAASGRARRDSRERARRVVCGTDLAHRHARGVGRIHRTYARRSSMPRCHSRSQRVPL
jgi:predicted NUDIX family phosphoesterase